MGDYTALWLLVQVLILTALIIRFFVMGADLGAIRRLLEEQATARHQGSEEETGHRD